MDCRDQRLHLPLVRGADEHGRVGIKRREFMGADGFAGTSVIQALRA
jgi:hypothetical protein